MANPTQAAVLIQQSSTKNPQFNFTTVAHNIKSFLATVLFSTYYYYYYYY